MNFVDHSPGDVQSSDQSGLSVSVVVPCRNERNHIEACVRSIVGQIDVAGGFEVIVVDGMSDDGTRDILRNLEAEFPMLTVLDNQRQITPVALNMGVRHARGEYIAILGAHTVYDARYLATCQQLLADHPEASGVGGPIRSRGRSLFGRAVARAMSHPLGIGNARHRHPEYEGYAEGACFPVYRRRVFEQYGLFNEALVRNQDDEFYLRLARGGERVFLSPRASCDYFVRERWSRLFRQYYQYGLWRAVVMRMHGRPMSLRQLVPSAFYLLVIVFLVLGLILPPAWRFVAVLLPAVYVAVLAGAAAVLAFKDGVGVAVRFVMAAATMHAAYAWGLAAGMRYRPMEAK